jgi:hypothetical protein
LGILNACACLFTRSIFGTNKRIFINTDFNTQRVDEDDDDDDFNMSYEAMAHIQSSRHDAENLRSTLSTQLYHFPWTVPMLNFGTPV